jgi:hypothetical protein
MEMKRHISYTLIIALFLGMFAFQNVRAQDEEEQGPATLDFAFKYFKRSQGMFELKAIVTIEGEDGYQPVRGLPVSFNHLAADSTVSLGTVETDYDGVAIILVSPEDIIYRDTGGLMGFSAGFDGDEKYDVAYEEIYAKDVRLTMTTEIVDSVKTVHVTAYYVKGDGQEYPINEQDIFLMKQGLLSKLQIADGWLVEGECDIEFPEGLPGDRNGNVELFVSILEHPDFGNVEVSETVNWGVVPPFITEESGQLWTTIAPTWMIVLLIILLAGVWGHYVYAMIQMRRISKTGKAS